MPQDRPGSDLNWPAGTPPAPAAVDAAGAAQDVQSLLPASMRRGADGAISALGALLEPRERPISLVSGHMEGERRRDRGRLILVTDRRVLISDLKGRAPAAWAWQEVDSFSTRNSNPLSYGACAYVLRFEDGTRVTLTNIAPRGRAFTVGQRIAWNVRASKLPVPGRRG